MKNGGIKEITIKKLVCKMCDDVGGYTCVPHKCINRIFE